MLAAVASHRHGGSRQLHSFCRVAAQLRWQQQQLQRCPAGSGKQWLRLSRPSTSSALRCCASVSQYGDSGGSNLINALRERPSTENANKVLFRIPGRDNDVPPCAERRSNGSEPMLRKAYTTYAQFWSLVARYARCLHEGYGVARGDRLIAQTSKSAENLALYFATLQLGAIYVPLNTDYTAEETLYFVNDARPQLMVVPTDRQDALRFDEYHPAQLLSETELFNAVWQHEELWPIAHVRPGDTAIICYTSGTTGRPKGAQMTHGNLVSNGRTLVGLWQMRADDTLIHALPVNHVHGLCVALHTALLADAEVVLLDRFQLNAVLDWLPYSTVMMGVPTYYSRLLCSDRFYPSLVANMRLFISGSAPMRAALWQHFKEASGGHEVVERYGMTETSMITSNPLDGPRVPGTVGRPLPDVQVRLCPKDNVIEVKGPNVFSGYWQQTEKTASSFTDDGWFRTGDIGEWTGPDANDPHLRIVGRESDMIITGGLNVYPAEVEKVIDAIELDGDVEIESAVIGVAHADFGEAVLAVCAVGDEAAAGDEIEREQLLDAIHSAVKQHLANYKQPKEILLVAALPRNQMGKVQKAVLRRQYGQMFV